MNVCFARLQFGVHRWTRIENVLRSKRLVIQFKIGACFIGGQGIDWRNQLLPFIQVAQSIDFAVKIQARHMVVSQRCERRFLFVGEYDCIPCVRYNGVQFPAYRLLRVRPKAKGFVPSVFLFAIHEQHTRVLQQTYVVHLEQQKRSRGSRAAKDVVVGLCL